MDRKTKYCVGIYFGQEYTSVSRVPGYNGQNISNIPLRRRGRLTDYKINSSISIDKEGRQRFVYSKLDCINSESCVRFTYPFSALGQQQKELFCEFAKLIFDSILANDSDLVYDEKKGYSNFVICISCPDGWEQHNYNYNEEYLKFFKEDCGIIPAQICIDESISLLYATCKELDYSGSVVNINIDSQITSLSTFQNLRRVKECCMNIDVGTNMLDEILIFEGWKNGMNIKGIEAAEALRRYEGLDSMEKYLTFAIRKARLNYFLNNKEYYECYLRFRELVPVPFPLNYKAFSLCLSKLEFDHITERFEKLLNKYFKEAAQCLSKHGIIPDIISLFGEAALIPFIKNLVNSSFPDAIIYCPILSISDGAAIYLKKQLELTSERTTDPKQKKSIVPR